MPFIKGIGVPELLIILVVVLVLFGPKQLPKLGKMFGKTMKEVRTGMDSFSEEMSAEKDKVDEVVAEAKESVETAATNVADKVEEVVSKDDASV